jgi:hypothetical protein
MRRYKIEEVTTLESMLEHLKINVYEDMENQIAEFENLVGLIAVHKDGGPKTDKELMIKLMSKFPEMKAHYYTETLSLIPNNWTELTDEVRQGLRQRVLQYYCLERWSLEWAYGYHIRIHERRGDKPMDPEFFLEINSHRISRMIEWFGKKAEFLQAHLLYGPFLDNHAMIEKYEDAIHQLAGYQRESEHDLWSVLSWIEIGDGNFFPGIKSEQHYKDHFPDENDVRNVSLTQDDMLPVPERFAKPILPEVFESDNELLAWQTSMWEYLELEKEIVKFAYCAWRDVTQYNQRMKTSAHSWFNYNNVGVYMRKYEHEYLTYDIDMDDDLMWIKNHVTLINANERNLLRVEEYKVLNDQLNPTSVVYCFSTEICDDNNDNSLNMHEIRQSNANIAHQARVQEYVAQIERDTAAADRATRQHQRASYLSHADSFFGTDSDDSSFAASVKESVNILQPFDPSNLIPEESGSDVSNYDLHEDESTSNNYSEAECYFADVEDNWRFVNHNNSDSDESKTRQEEDLEIENQVKPDLIHTQLMQEVIALLQVQVGEDAVQLGEDDARQARLNDAFNNLHQYENILNEQAVDSNVTITECESFYSGVDHESILVDSGSTAHIVNNVRNMSRIVQKRDSVRTGTGSRSEIIGEGELSLETTDGVLLIIKKVSVVPGFQKQLLRLKLLMETGIIPHFTETGGHLQDPNGNRLLLHREQDGMWYIRVKNKATNRPSRETNRQSKDINVNPWITPKRRMKSNNFNKRAKLPKPTAANVLGNGPRISQRKQRTETVLNTNRNRFAILGKDLPTKHDHHNDKQGARTTTRKPLTLKTKIAQAEASKRHLQQEVAQTKKNHTKTNQNERRFVKHTKVRPTTTTTVARADNQQNQSKLKTIDINEWHLQLNHAGENILRSTARAMNVKLVGTLRDCVACSKAKARNKNTSKKSKNPATQPGQRLQVDISGPFHKGLGGSRYWLKIVDEHSTFSFDRYLKRKSELWIQVKGVVRTLRALGHKVDTICCDNAGENTVPLKTWCDQNSGGYIFLEYTAPYTPQHNGIVERRFATDGTRAHSSMIQQEWKQSFINKMWCEATYTASKLTNSMNGPNQDISPFEMIFGRKDSSISPIRLVPFGQLAEVKLPLKPQKFHDKSVPMVMVGYADDNASDCFKFYNPKTDKIVMSRNMSSCTQQMMPDT